MPWTPNPLSLFLRSRLVTPRSTLSGQSTSHMWWDKVSALLSLTDICFPPTRFMSPSCLFYCDIILCFKHINYKCTLGQVKQITGTKYCKQEVLLFPCVNVKFFCHSLSFQGGDERVELLQLLCATHGVHVCRLPGRWNFHDPHRPWDSVGLQGPSPFKDPQT